MTPIHPGSTIELSPGETLTAAPRATELLLDLETLDTAPTAVITELAAATFHRTPEGAHIHDEIELHLDPWEQIRLGRTTSPDTIAFHQKHRTLPGPNATETPLAAIDALRMISDGIKTVWIWGTDFDRPILEDLHTQLHRQLPFLYWQLRDARTVWKLALPETEPNPRRHHAIDDVRASIRDLHTALTKLNR